jgi:uncharacterized protein involved in outer membrane biogenesis
MFSWQRPEHERGWRRWVPWPHFRAQGVDLGNADWTTTGKDMAHIAQVDFGINPFALLAKDVEVTSLVMKEPHLVLEQNGKGKNNWTFPQQPGSNWKVHIHDLTTTQGTIRYVDPARRADLRMRIDTLPDNSVVWKLGGKFSDEPVSGEAKSGALLSIQATGVPYPIEGKVVVGESSIDVKGTLTDPSHPSAIDADLKILGASMADLFPLSGVLLPETPKFSTEGRVVGTFGRGNLKLRYEKFKGKVGSSDIEGTLEYAEKNPRPLLSGDVESHHLNLSDLAALVGAGQGGKKQKSGEVKQPPDKVLPVAPFKTDRWGKMDADVQFNGNEITSSGKVPLENVHTHLKMTDGVLSLDPLNFGIADGRLTTDLTIDGRHSPAQARLKVSARHLKLKALFPTVKEMHASLGQVHGDAKLTATGNSFAALAASSNGELIALMSQGTVSQFMMEEIGLNIGRMVVSKLFGDRQVAINCMAADFKVNDGDMQPNLFLIDTDDAIVRMSGDIDLASEKLDLTISPKSKGIRLLSLRSPIYLKGTFKHPDIGVNKAMIGAKAAAAVALGTVASPIAALLALTQPDSANDAPCGKLLSSLDKKPVAPPLSKKSDHAKLAGEQKRANK